MHKKILTIGSSASLVILKLLDSDAPWISRTAKQIMKKAAVHIPVLESAIFFLAKVNKC